MSSSDKGKRKRQYIQGANNYHHQGHSQKWQPKRGGPAVLLTCDTGHDSKAKREGLEILEYYLHRDDTPTKQDDDGKKEEGEEAPKPLSLDEELAQLQSEHQKAPNGPQQQQHPKQHDYKKKPFAYYDTGCKGTVFLFCMLPDCALIPSIQAAKNNLKKQKDADTNGGEKSSDSTANKKAKIVEEGGSTQPSETPLAVTTTSPLPWDPLATVRRVMHDLDQESKPDAATHRNIPGSRFVSRMIPMQATCFASLEEIQLTFRSLLERTVLSPTPGASPPSPRTFGIKFKKRNCGGVTRDQVIAEIGKQVDEATGKTWTVHLDNPDYRIQIEICKTLCGMSILAATNEDAFMSQHNFNVADLRAQAAVARKGPNMSLQKEEEPSDKPASA